MSGQALWWAIFGVLVLMMLVIDLGFFHRKSREITVKEALVWSGVWIGLALAFNLALYFWRGEEIALAFLTGYLIEKSLSVDNVFVFYMIFTYFAVTPAHQYRVLFWGIIGALVMRAVLVSVGVVLVESLHWVIYVFGGFLVITGIRMAFESERELHPDANPAVKLFRKLMPVAEDYAGDRFFIVRAGRRLATPLFLVLLVVEFTDLIFAVDSIPAILAITTDPFVVYTSNVFAILGLRALYFALAGVVAIFRYLRFGLAVILAFVGSKMLLADVYKIPTAVSLCVVMGIIAISVVASLIAGRGRDDTAA